MGILYIVATPIGNLKDITLRALEILKGVNYIIAEDTRKTSILLKHYNIKTRLISFHQHSSQRKYQSIIEILGEGNDIALVTDAGTPAIADPGGRLIAEVCQTLGDKVKVQPIPGANAAISALSIAGMPADRFIFYGFLPHKKGRQKMLQEIAGSKMTAVLYESPHRIIKTLTSLSELLDKNRQIVLTRELTKKFETVYRGTALEVLAALKKDVIKGEFVIIIASR